ncbi:hypothetical protein Trydic_g10766 [Trypoxylus dichotomus]
MLCLWLHWLDHYDSARKQYFNDKTGLWPFVYKGPAKRNNKDRARGTMVTKNIESINAAECRKMIIEAHKVKTIYVQQAKPHSCDNGVELLAEDQEMN